MAQHNELGKKGELLAIDFLLDKGYTILEKNYRYLKAEVDIIVQKEQVLAAVEVKTRSTAYFGSPEEFVNPKKNKITYFCNGSLCGGAQFRCRGAF